MKHLILLLTLTILTGCGSKENSPPSAPPVGIEPCVDCIPEDDPLGRITKTDYTLNDLWQEGFPKDNLDAEHHTYLKGNGFEIAPIKNDLYGRAFYLEKVHCGGITDQRTYVGFTDEYTKNSQILIRITGNRIEQFSYRTTINSNPSAYAQVEKISEETWDCVEGVLHRPGDVNYGTPDSDNYLALGSIAVGKIGTWFVLAFQDNSINPTLPGTTEYYQVLYKSGFLQPTNNQEITIGKNNPAKLIYYDNGFIQCEYTANSNIFSQIISGNINTRIFTAHSGIQQEKAHFIQIKNLSDKNNQPKECIYGNFSEDLNTKFIDLVMACK
ncbi:MAG: hypothetical protein H6626_05700 [Pseudobdellovibrionaceae bacterium]|nr:hypothetical protein [Bdellovibrionales bacterium]USN48588.1 MAG: hypothetical protein H6626_05700 [Pseudobdellovibrionaceae bacterium]